MDAGRVNQRTFGFARRLEGSHHAMEIGANAQGDVQQDALRAEDLADAFQKGGEVDVIGIHLVEDEHPGQPGLVGLGEDAAGVDFDAGLGVDHDGRRIDPPQGPDGLADEIGVARGVEHVEVLAGVVEKHRFGFDGVAVRSFFLVEIADAGPLIHAGRPVHHAGEGQHAIDQGRLARGLVAAQGQIADGLDRVGWHESDSSVTVMRWLAVLASPNGFRQRECAFV